MMTRLLVLIGCLLPSLAHAEGEGGGGAGLGVTLGVGIPYVTQVGVDYRFSPFWGLSAVYNSVDVTIDESTLKLTMPEVLINVHPFSGAWFVAAGVGKESLVAKATDQTGTAEAKIEVEATTTIVKTGWKWGIADKGFWFGIDFAYVMPSSADKTITAPGVPTTDPNYQDAVDAADKFGETSYPHITLARLGWMF